jgi:hypothetical protein
VQQQQQQQQQQQLFSSHACRHGQSLPSYPPQLSLLSLVAAWLPLLKPPLLLLLLLLLLILLLLYACTILPSWPEQTQRAQSLPPSRYLRYHNHYTRLI